MLFAVVTAFVLFGMIAFVNFPFLQVTMTMLTATAIGCFLSLVGVIYPAFKAARMEPVEAMRVEE